MRAFISMSRRMGLQEDGASASEYAVLVAIIIVAIATAVSYFNLGNIYSFVNETILNCVNGTC